MRLYSLATGRREGITRALGINIHLTKTRSNSRAAQVAMPPRLLGGPPSAVDMQSAKLSQACRASAHLANRWRRLRGTFTSSAVLWLLPGNCTVVPPHLLWANTSGAPTEEQFIGLRGLPLGLVAGQSNEHLAADLSGETKHPVEHRPSLTPLLDHNVTHAHPRPVPISRLPSQTRCQPIGSE